MTLTSTRFLLSFLLLKLLLICLDPCDPNPCNPTGTECIPVSNNNKICQCLPFRDPILGDAEVHGCSGGRF